MHNEITFTLDGQLLRRGFWVYVWKVTDQNNDVLYYVGRTGDSSSNNAASPYSRVFTHLSSKAKGNSLFRNLSSYDVNIEKSMFKMFAYGPMFEEQDTFEEHKVYRDKTAIIEREVANLLRQKRVIVMGIHSAPRKASEQDVKLANYIVEKAMEL